METFLDSKLNPFVALAKRGTMKGFVNKFNGEAELLDDLVSDFYDNDFVSLTIVFAVRTTIGQRKGTRYLQGIGG